MKRLLAHIALSVVALTYGGNYLVAKGLMPDLVGPSGFIVLRVTGALVLFGLLLLARSEKVDRKDLPRMAFCGLTGVGINMLLFFNGLNVTSPVNASLIMTVNPILVLLASAVMLGQPIVRRRLGRGHPRGHRGGGHPHLERIGHQGARHLAGGPDDPDQCDELRILPRRGQAVDGQIPAADGGDVGVPVRLALHHAHRLEPGRRHRLVRL